MNMSDLDHEQSSGCLARLVVVCVTPVLNVVECLSVGCVYLRAVSVAASLSSWPGIGVVSSASNTPREAWGGGLWAY